MIKLSNSLSDALGVGWGLSRGWPLLSECIRVSLKSTISTRSFGTVAYVLTDLYLDKRRLLKLIALNIADIIAQKYIDT